MSSTRSATVERTGKKRPKESLVAVGIVLFAVICCAGLLLAGTLGVGVGLSALTSPWLLVPTALAVVGIFAWHSRRRSS
jgi:ABC-type amino acid transport system permease subunit